MTLYPATGGATIRVYERLGPVLRFSQVIQRVLAADPLFRVNAVADCQMLTTDEGEYGAWCRVDGVRQGARCVRFVASVYGDEFTLALDAFVELLTQVAAIQETARELVLTCSLKLGFRRRRFVYEAPATWTALASGLVANWYPPDFPANRVNIVVPAAEPSEASADHITDPASLIADYSARGFALEGGVELEPVQSLAGTSGRRCALLLKHVVTAECRRIEVGAFVASPYVYVMRMESLVPSRAREHHQIFLETLRSVAVVPAPGIGRVGMNPVPDDAFSHWAD